MFHAKGLLYIAKGAMVASPPSSRQMLFTTVCKVPTPGTLKRKWSLAFNHQKVIFQRSATFFQSTRKCMIYLHLRGSVVSHIITLVFISHGSNLQYRKYRYASDLYMMKNKINTFVVLNLPLCCFKTKKISIYQLPFYHSSLKSIL